MNIEKVPVSDTLPESEKHYGLFTEESCMVGIQQNCPTQVQKPKEKSVCRGESYPVAFRYHSMRNMARSPSAQTHGSNWHSGIKYVWATMS